MLKKKKKTEKKKKTKKQKPIFTTRCIPVKVEG